MATHIEVFQDTLVGRIDISKYSNYNKLLRVTAIIMNLYDRNPKSSLKNATNDLTPDDVEKAELFWIREAQQEGYREWKIQTTMAKDAQRWCICEQRTQRIMDGDEL